jgi:hypothetical protein
MTVADLVPADQIETIVGARRHRDQHLGRAVSAEQTVYILHSETCRDSGIDLRDCAYSKALDNGIDMDWWHQHQDRAVVVAPFHDRLIPVTPEWLDEQVIRPVGGDSDE